MSEDKKDITVEGHKKFAPELFNFAWDLIDKKDRTPEETDLMLHAAHASAYHWSSLGGHVDDERWKQSFAISHNQLVYVYIEVGDAERALYHAKRSLEYFEKYGEGGFPIAYCYERLAKVYDVMGEHALRDAEIKKAIDAGNRIPEDNFREAFFSELEKIPGYEKVKSEMK